MYTFRRCGNDFIRGGKGIKEGNNEGRKEEGKKGRDFFSADLAFQLRLPVIPHLICCHNKPDLNEGPGVFAHNFLQ